jgi:hypothetical protein
MANYFDAINVRITSAVPQPPEEAPALSRAHRALSYLAYHFNDFRSALQLFEYCEAKKRAHPEPFGADYFAYDRWRYIAARDGVMQIYHFSKAMEALISALPKAKTLGSYIDFKRLRIADGLFNSWFGNIDGLRHTVGHIAEFGRLCTT